MSRTRLHVIVVLIVVAVGAVAFAGLRPARPKPPPPPPATESPHAASMDRSFAAYLAMLHAPEGATPCETAYNAYKASLDAAEAAKSKPIVLFLTNHDKFQQLCAAFPENMQRCLSPAYIRTHHDACPPMTDPGDLARFKEMVELRGRGYDPADPSEGTPEAPPTAPSGR
jgi:hypothetical protein